jgi:hypothetical protein
MAFPPNNPSPEDRDVFTPTDTIRSGVSNFTLTAEELNRRFIAQNRANLNAQANDESIGTSNFGNDFSQPEPPASAQISGTNLFVESFDSGFQQPDDRGGSSSAVARMEAGQNTIPASGAAVPAKSRSNSDSGLSPNIRSVIIDPEPNQLSDYASHTYNIALYMMQPKNYIKLLQNPTSVGQIPKQLIMRSGGVGQDGGDNFDVDFFIDNLKMKNVGVSANTRTSNTNAVDISFDITEPMGITLIERLKTEAKNSLGEEENYIKTPYLLELTFKGYDDTGKQIVGAIKPKYVPIRITDLHFRLESTGTVYKVRAMPFHQDVFGSITSTIPINIQVGASTVQDVFDRSAQEIIYKDEEEVGIDADGAEIGLIKTGNKISVLGEISSSLTDAVNNFFISQTKETTDKDGKKIASSALIAERWSFAIAPEITNAKLVGQKFDALNTPQKTKNVYQQAADGIKGQVKLDSETSLFKINAGTNIVSLINYIIVSSDYIDQNINDNPGAAGDMDAMVRAEENEFINWFKIVPEIKECLGWDKKQGRYKYHIRWTILVHGMHYSDFPNAPQTKPKGQGVHKIYDYIFSGLNTEITDLMLEFNSAFFQAHTIGTGIPVGNKDKSNLAPQSKVMPFGEKGQGIINNATLTKKRSKDLMSNIMYDGADMIQINLSILGDPAFLPVGDAFFQPQGNLNRAYDKPFLPDGTINYDLTPPYIQLNLKTPSDYDDLTGLVDPYSKGTYTTSEFSGVYRIVQTESTFVGGMFTQSLSAIREKMQPIGGKIGRSVESIRDVERQGEERVAQGFLQELLQTVLTSRNPVEALISQGAATLTTLGNSAITSLISNITQSTADEVDQDRGLFDNDFQQPSEIEFRDNGRIIDETETATIFREE